MPNQSIQPKIFYPLFFRVDCFIPYNSLEEEKLKSHLDSPSLLSPLLSNFFFSLSPLATISRYKASVSPPACYHYSVGHEKVWGKEKKRESVRKGKKNRKCEERRKKPVIIGCVSYSLTPPPYPFVSSLAHPLLSFIIPLSAGLFRYLSPPVQSIYLSLIVGIPQVPPYLCSIGRWSPIILPFCPVPKDFGQLEVLCVYVWER